MIYLFFSFQHFLFYVSLLVKMFTFALYQFASCFKMTILLLLLLVFLSLLLSSLSWQCLSRFSWWLIPVYLLESKFQQPQFSSTCLTWYFLHLTSSANLLIFSTSLWDTNYNWNNRNLRQFPVFLLLILYHCGSKRLSPGTAILLR